MEVELSEDQVQLFTAIVTASRSAKREFYVARYTGGSFLEHPGLPEGKLEVYWPDLLALLELGLATITSHDSRTGNPSMFDVSPYGLHVFTVIHSQKAAAETVEDEIRRYLDADTFSRRFTGAHSKWSTAVELLWAEDVDSHLTEIGHCCREAMQEFADVVCAELPIHGESSKANTVRRIRSAVDARSASLGSSAAAMLDALLVYWGTVSDLAQRQEHAGAKEGESVGWEDARRLVFQTANVMFELGHALVI